MKFHFQNSLKYNVPYAQKYFDTYLPSIINIILYFINGSTKFTFIILKIL